MNRILVLAGALVLAACTHPRPPPPAPPPRPVRVQRAAPADVAAARAEIASARAKLAAYLALPPCAPSGAVACRDDDQAAQAVSAGHEAAAALARARGSKSALPAMTRRARAFDAAVKHLPTGSSQ